MEAVRVLTVDHGDACRRAARALVNAAPGFDWAAEAASAEEALEQALPLRPELILLAEEMPGIDGLETSRRLTEVLPDAVVVLVYSGKAPDGDSVAGSGAVAAVHHDALSPAALRGLWDEHGGGRLARGLQ